MTTARSILVLGDIGGRVELLQSVLIRLGIRDGQMPPTLVVLQVGDLARAGDPPGCDSFQCLDIADRLMASYPNQWLQLFGNHDLALIGGSRRVTWPPASNDNPRAAAIVDRWWEAASAKLAFSATDPVGRPALVTHAGMTVDRWQALGEPSDAAHCADLINRDVGGDLVDILSPGSLVLGSGATGQRPLDVVWPEVVHELDAPWIQLGAMPFDQVHGHASPWNWSTETWWPGTPQSVQRATEISAVERRTVTKVADGHSLTGIDVSPAPVGSEWTWPLLVLAEQVGQ